MKACFKKIKIKNITRVRGVIYKWLDMVPSISQDSNFFLRKK